MSLFDKGKAKKGKGGLNRVLNFIGLEDDGRQPEQPVESAYSAGNYANGSTYVPQSRRSAQRSVPQPRSIPAQAGRSQTGARRTYGADDYASGAYARRSEYDMDDYEPRTRAPEWEQPRRSAEPQRTRSRFEEEPPRVSTPAPRMRPAVRQQKTVMRTLTSLEDCCELIDELINHTTIVLTMDTDDEHVLQRAVDTLSGAVYALHATIRKASEATYLLAPEGVEVNTSNMGRDRY